MESPNQEAFSYMVLALKFLHYFPIFILLLCTKSILPRIYIYYKTLVLHSRNQKSFQVYLPFLFEELCSALSIAPIKLWGHPLGALRQPLTEKGRELDIDTTHFDQALLSPMGYM